MGGEMKLVVGGGKKGRQKRAGRVDGWTKPKEVTFLDALADSCNVTFAAAKAGMSPSGAHKRRRSHAAFRAGWDEALATGYAALEMEMLKRALHGVEKTSVSRTGETTTVQSFDDRTALALLRLHRDRVQAIDAGPDAEAVEEARERILARLERLREKMAVETKAAPDTIALIRWALQHQ